MRDAKFWILLFTSLFLSISLLEAEDYSSGSFILRDPVITVEGGRSTSTSFEYFSSSGQAITGENTSSNFIHRAGFLYFEEEAAETTSSATPGEGIIIPKAQVEFSGRAYPASQVTILRDAQVAAVVSADAQGEFHATISELRGGSYIFTLYATDYQQRHSRLTIFHMQIAQDKVRKVEGVIIPPTLFTDTVQVKKGESFTVEGQSGFRATVEISVKGSDTQFSVRELADARGAYTRSFVTDELPFGDYQITARTYFPDGAFSELSRIVEVAIGDGTLLRKPFGAGPLQGDVNDDKRVNLIDFSILLYWFGRENVPSKVDLDHNQKADLVDFSIMAYYWTG